MEASATKKHCRKTKRDDLTFIKRAVKLLTWSVYIIFFTSTFWKRYFQYIQLYC